MQGRSRSGVIRSKVERGQQKKGDPHHRKGSDAKILLPALGKDQEEGKVDPERGDEVGRTVTCAEKLFPAAIQEGGYFSPTKTNSGISASAAKDLLLQTRRSVAARCPGLEGVQERLHEHVPVHVVEYDRLPAITPGHNMVNGSFVFHSRCSWHLGMITGGIPVCQDLSNKPFYLRPHCCPKHSHVVCFGQQCRPQNAEMLEMRIRSVRTHDFKYIRNFHPEVPYMQHSGCKRAGYPFDPVMRVLDKEGKWTSPFMVMTKPEEELYDPEADPWEMNNLASEPAMVGALVTLRSALDDWIVETGDLGALTKVSPSISMPFSPKSGPPTKSG